MATLTIRNLSDEVHRALKARAIQNGRSMEAEMRAILEAAVLPEGACGSVRLWRKSAGSGESQMPMSRRSSNRSSRFEIGALLSP